MDQVSEDVQRTLERVLRKHRKRLLAYPNVHDVDVGLEFADGYLTGRLALRVHVTKKVARAGLANRELVPDELDGVPVDVIQFNPQPHAIPRNQRHDPLLAGVRIQNTMLTGGCTLGMIVFDRDSLEPLAISNHHVMVRTPAVASDPRATRGWCACQRARHRGPLEQGARLRRLPARDAFVPARDLRPIRSRWVSHAGPHRHEACEVGS